MTTAADSSVLTYIEVLARWRWRIVLNVFVTAVIAAGISLVLPKSYTAESVILPPEESDMMGFSFSSLLEGTPLASLGMPGISTPASAYLAILKSREAAQFIVETFSLKKRYNARTIDDAMMELRTRVKIDLTDEGMILIRVVDKDPAVAAAIANKYVELLNERYVSMNVEKARSNRMFIEERLAQNIAALAEAENALKRFQTANKAVSLPEQVKASLGVISELHARRLQLEVERDILSRTMGEGNPRLREIVSSLQELNRSILDIENGRSGNKSYFPVAFSDLPALGLELTRLTRDVKIQEAIFELLTQQHEHAKLQEAKDTPAVQVLDRAVPPEKRTWPKRTLIVLMCAFIGFALTAAYAMLAHYSAALDRSDDPGAVAARNIRDMIAGDLQRIFRRSRK